MHRILICLSGLTAVLGARITSTHTATAMANDGATVYEGAMLGNFELVEQLSSRARSQGNLSAEEWPHNLAGMSLMYGQDAKLLGRGSFGEVWKAIDKRTGRDVAIKFFPVPRDDLDKILGREQRYKTQANANYRSMKAASAECDLQRSLMYTWQKDPAGAAHIAACLENHINPDKDAAASGHQVAFLVLQPGGNEIKDWIGARSGLNVTMLTEQLPIVRKVVAQVLQALRYLTSLSPAIIHHDLKPANIVYEAGDGFDVGKVRLIDFGGAMMGTAEQQSKGSVYTPGYVPPEFNQDDPFHKSKAFYEPWHSFDMYSTGVIYLMLACPQLDRKTISSALKLYPERAAVKELFSAVQSSGSANKICPEVPEDEQALIASMVAADPGHRPSPSDLLSNPVLSPYVDETPSDEVVAELKDAVSSTPVSEALETMEVVEGFEKDGRLHNSTEEGEDVYKKCCCNAASAECRMIDLSEPHPSCDKKWGRWRRESCSCLVGDGWVSYRRLALGQCIIKSE